MYIVLYISSVFKIGIKTDFVLKKPGKFATNRYTLSPGI